jgi:methionyl aminopeptidase
MVFLKSPDEIEKIYRASQIVAQTLEILGTHVKPGISTKELDKIAEEEIRKAGAVPAFIGYRGFPATLCVSVNEEIVHGIPSQRRLKEGEIVGLDLGAIWQGFYGDAARTFVVGSATEDAVRLVDVTEKSLQLAIEQCKPGNRIGDIGYAVQSYAEKNGYSVVRDFVGHGIGRKLHEEPQVPNYGNRGQGPRLKPGLVIAIEPMVCAGRAEVDVLSDDWTAVTRDGSLSAHFEHSVAITENGPWILSELV